MALRESIAEAALKEGVVYKVRPECLYYYVAE